MLVMLETLGRLPLFWLFCALLAATAFVAFSGGKLTYARSFPTPLSTRSNSAGYLLALVALLPILPLFVLYAWSCEPILRDLLERELPPHTGAWTAEQMNLFFDQIYAQLGHRMLAPIDSTLLELATRRYSALRGQAHLILLALSISCSGLCYLLTWQRIQRGLSLQRALDRALYLALFGCATLAILTTAGIIASLIYETGRFFSHPDGPSLASFLFGINWNAQSGQSFGILPLLLGTFMIAIIALMVAVPIGLMCAIYLSEYATPRMRETLKPLLEILAGIPTVVYGFFAAIIIAPAVRAASQWINHLPFTPETLLAAQPTNALAAGLVMGVMIIPLMSSLSDDILRTIPQSLRDGALAMGSTQSETITRIVVPAAMPGIIAALLLSASRAIGETMIVVMAAGGRAIMTLDPTSDMTTVTHQIVTILTGDTSFDSARTLAAFALGFALFSVTFIFNVIALRVVRSYRVRYV